MGDEESRKQSYDHRLRELVRRAGDIRVATDLGVPRSTAVGWLRGELPSVVSLDILGQSEVDLVAEVVRLRRRLRTLTAVVGLLLAVRRVTGSSLEQTPVSDPGMRAFVLRAAERARKTLPASRVLRILGISQLRATRSGPEPSGAVPSTTMLDAQGQCPIS